MSRTLKVKMTNRTCLCTLAPGVRIRLRRWSTTLSEPPSQRITSRPGPSAGVLQSGRAHPFVSARGTSPGGAAEAGPWTQTGNGAGTRVPRVRERGGHRGRGSPGDWKRLWAGREGRGGVSCTREKLWWGWAFPFVVLLPLLLLPPLPHLPPLLPSPLPPPPPPTPPAQVAASLGSCSPFQSRGSSPDPCQGPQQGARRRAQGAAPSPVASARVR